MQAMVQKFVEERTLLLAAISHDLRTPLTKMRLRGEFIEDDAQRAGLFRDVEDMRLMIDSALAFFRDDFQHEGSTVFDFSELLRTVADDHGDLGIAVSYGSCPLPWCSNRAAEQGQLLGHAARGGRLTAISSLSGAMVSRLMYRAR